MHSHDRSIMTRRMLLGVLLLAGIAVTGAAEERTSQNDAQLRQWLKQYPEADADKDSILTETEARAYRAKTRPAPDRQRLLLGLMEPSYADVRYGPHDRNVLDVYLAQSDKPTPLLIYIHGGGFVGGDKLMISPQAIKACDRAGVSVATIHYRFVTTHPFPAPQHDAARAVQFLRSKADDWNLDARRFAAYGESAGAGLSMWLGFHDDLADMDSEDPMARESTRLKAVGSVGGQSTYDPNIIKKWVGGRAHEHPSIFKCYGVKSVAEFTDSKLQPIYDEVSAIEHLTKDDPPVYMFYSEPDAPLPEDARPGQGIHHPVFGHKLKAEMDRLGIDCVYRHTSEFQGNPASDMIEHLLKWLDAPAETE